MYGSYFIAAQLLMNHAYLIAANTNNSVSSSSSQVLTSFRDIPTSLDIRSSLFMPIYEENTVSLPSWMQDSEIPAYETAINHALFDIAKAMLEQGKKHPIAIETLQKLYDAKQCMLQEHYSKALILFNQVIDAFSVIETNSKHIAQAKIDQAFEILKEYQDLLAISHHQIAKIYAIQGDLKEASANGLIAVLYATPPRLSFHLDYLDYLFQQQKYAVVIDFAEKSFLLFPQHPKLRQWQEKAILALNNEQSVTSLKYSLNWNWVMLSVVGFLLLIFGLFKFKNKRNVKIPAVLTVPKTPKIKPKPIDHLQHKLSEYRSRVETAIKRTSNFDHVLSEFHDKALKLQHEVKILKQSISKYSRGVLQKELEKFDKYIRSFNLAYKNYLQLEENIEQDILQIEPKLTLLLEQLRELQPESLETNQGVYVGNYIAMLEQHFDFKERLQLSLNSLGENYDKISLCYNRINKDHQRFLQQQKLQDKQEQFFKAARIDNHHDAQNDEDNSNNNYAKKHDFT